MTLLVAFSFLVSLGVTAASPTTPTPTCPKLKAYVAYDNGGLIISENGGQTWARRDPAGTTGIAAVWASGANVFLGTNAGLSVSRNGGHTWTSQYFRKDNNRVINSVFGTGNRIVLTGFANVTISEDLGKSWTVQTIPSINNMLEGAYATDKRVVVGLGATNGIGISDDGGVTWRIINKDTVFESVGVLAIAGSGNDIYVQLSRAGIASIAISNDGGESWGMQEVTTVTPSAGFANNIAVDGKTVLVGTTVGLAMSDDIWNNWELKTTVDGLAGNSTLVAALGDTILAGTDKGVSISHDRGNTWTTPETPLVNNKITAVFLDCPS